MEIGSALLRFLFFQFDLQNSVSDVLRKIEEVQQSLEGIQRDYMPEKLLLDTTGILCVCVCVLGDVSRLFTLAQS